MFNTRFIELIYKFGKHSQCPFNVLFIMYVPLTAQQFIFFIFYPRENNNFSRLFIDQIQKLWTFRI